MKHIGYLLFILFPPLFGAINVRFVDQNNRTGNLLFEGNLPQDTNGHFSQKKLISALKKGYVGIFPSTYNLIIISHLTTENGEETLFLSNIYTYFQGTSVPNASDIPQQVPINKAGKGTLYWWPVRGFKSHTPPFSSDVSWATLDNAYKALSEEDVHKELVNQSFNGKLLNFPGLISLIELLMQTDTPSPQVIYIHSRRGANRNTVSMSAYLMKTACNTVQQAWNTTAPTLLNKEQVFEPQEAKSFLYYYKRYLELLN
ncbi:MAG: hypothetical protein KBC64_04760 [Simkaniaceae bacterium]|nr:hypothetical protein [Simkaniaceae bacterium]